MTIAQHKIQLAQKILETDDRHILKTIELLFNQEEEQNDLSQAQKKELDKRLEELESGRARLYTMSEAKRIIRKNFKK